MRRHSPKLPPPEVRNELRKAIDCLERAEVFMRYGNVQNFADTTEFFVRQHYVDFLNREPDDAGLAFWTNEIASCGTHTECREVRRVNVSAAFFLSIEFQETGYHVYRMYKATYGRMPTLAEFSPDIAEIAQRVIVGAADWGQQLEANKSGFYWRWVQRPGFVARYGHLTNAQYVDALITNAGVPVSPQKRDSWVSALNAGTPRDSVLRQLVEYGEFVRRELAPAFVMMQYIGYLRRDPDAGGFQFWLEKLNQFGGDYRRAEMVRAFLDSIEYRERFSRL